MLLRRIFRSVKQISIFFFLSLTPPLSLSLGKYTLIIYYLLPVGLRLVEFLLFFYCSVLISYWIPHTGKSTCNVTNTDYLCLECRQTVLWSLKPHVFSAKHLTTGAKQANMSRYMYVEGYSIVQRAQSKWSTGSFVSMSVLLIFLLILKD